MRYVLIAILIFSFSGIYACVTFDIKNETYTVDSSGCVEN